MVRFEFKLGFPSMVSCDIVYKFQMTSLRGTQVIEQKPNTGRTDRQTWVKLNALDD